MLPAFLVGEKKKQKTGKAKVATGSPLNPERKASKAFTRLVYNATGL